VFKRRTRRTYAQSFSALFSLRAWARGTGYVLHRLRRLPDPPHRIARGVGVGVFVCFTPLFGFHFVLAATLAFLLRGNILAALLATFFGNPLTFPVIAVVSIELGAWMLGIPGGMPLPHIAQAFSSASVELWANIVAMFTADVARWDRLAEFYRTVFLPYLLGGLFPGVVTGAIAYAVSLPAISAYQKARIRRLKKRYEKRRALEAQKADVAGNPH